MHRLWGLAAVLLAAGCLREKVQYCNNGALCPEPLVCTERSEAPFCGEAIIVTECLGKQDEDPCLFEGDKNGYCDAGLCKECNPNLDFCHYTDWVAMQPPVNVDLAALWVAGPSDVYVAGRQGTVIHWDGKQWIQLPPTGMSDLKSLGGAGANDLWAAASTDAYHYNGTTWTAQAPTSSTIFGIWAAGPNDFFSAGFNSTVGRYTGGSAWSYMEGLLAPANVSFNAVWGTSNANVYVVGGNGTVIRWNGSSWSAPQATPATHVLLAVHGSSETNIFAVGRTATAANAPIVFRFDGSWQDRSSTLPSDVTQPLRGVWSTTGHVFAVGGAGKIVHSTDNGASWMTMPVPVTNTIVLNGVAGSGNAVFAVGDKGTILRYEIP